MIQGLFPTAYTIKNDNTTSFGRQSDKPLRDAILSLDHCQLPLNGYDKRDRIKLFELSQESEEGMFQKRKRDEMKYHPIYLIIIFARKLFMTSERKTGQKSYIIM